MPDAAATQSLEPHLNSRKPPNAQRTATRPRKPSIQAPFTQTHLKNAHPRTPTHRGTPVPADPSTIVRPCVLFTRIHAHKARPCIYARAGTRVPTVPRSHSARRPRPYEPLFRAVSGLGNGLAHRGYVAAHAGNGVARGQRNHRRQAGDGSEFSHAAMLSAAPSAGKLNGAGADRALQTGKAWWAR